MVEKLYIECAVPAVAIRVILAAALWIAASMALNGCASQPHAAHALAPVPMAAPAAEQAPAFRLAGPHVPVRLELPIPDLSGDEDETPLRRRQCDEDATFGSAEAKAPSTEPRFALGCTFTERASACR